MVARSYHTSLTVKQSPAAVFAAINNVGKWWPKIKGHADAVGAIFRHEYEDMHRCELQVRELVPNQKVVWTVLDNHFSFTKDPTEWKNTDIVFEIAEKDGRTELKFTHHGLVPAYECYGVCSDAWHDLISGRLRELIAAAPTAKNIRNSGTSRQVQGKSA